MKKNIMICITVLVFLLTNACANSKGTMLKNAEEFFVEKGNIKSDVKKNPINAEKEYENKTYKVTGAVIGIEKNYVELFLINLSDTISAGTNAKVFLPEKEIKQLEINDIINVVGRLDISVGGGGYIKEYDFKNAHYIDNIIEFRNEITGFIEVGNLYGKDGYEGVSIKTTCQNTDYDRYSLYGVYADGALKNDKVVIEGTEYMIGDTVVVRGVFSLEGRYKEEYGRRFGKPLYHDTIALKLEDKISFEKQ